MANLSYLQHRIELARAELHKIAEKRDTLLHPEVLEHSEQLDAWLNQYHQELQFMTHAKSRLSTQSAQASESGVILY